MIAAPAEGADVHLEALSRLSTLLMNPEFMEETVKGGIQGGIFERLLMTLRLQNLERRRKRRASKD